MTKQLILGADDESELFYAFRNRGDSATKRKVAAFLRELDSQKGNLTSSHYWYSEPAMADDGLDAAVRAVVNAAPTITSVKSETTNGSCTLTALFSDFSERRLFSFYVDELCFSNDELIGLTEAQAHELRHSKDVAYLRS